MAPPPEPAPPQSPAGGAIRDAWFRLHDWWSKRALVGQVIAATTVSIVCGSLAWFALSPSFTDATAKTRINWAYGTYSVARHCKKGGVVPLEIDNTSSASVMAEVQSPGYAHGFGKRPLYLTEESAASRSSISVPAHGRVTVYLKLGDLSWECSNDATDVLEVVSASPANSAGPTS